MIKVADQLDVSPRVGADFQRSALHHVPLFLLSHIALGFLFRAIPFLATPYAYVLVAIGIIAGLRFPRYAAYAAAYICGAEVLWRMVGAGVFWEFGKYAVILILIFALFHHKQRRIPVAPLMYFVLLLPSILLTLDALDLSSARAAISSNLSGPLALFVSCWFFSSLRLGRDQLARILLALAAPAVATATYTLLGTITAEHITWVNDSMFQTSGGFGPNQVSTIMGLGVIMIWLLFLLGRISRISRLLLVVLGGLLFVQGLLTFSRGGILAAVIVLGFFTIHSVRNSQQRTRLMVFLIIFVPVIIFVAVPALDEFTQGYLAVRFTDTNLSGRDVIVQNELQMFLDSPIWGFGPGMTAAVQGVGAHTEMARLLAEHGLFGAISLLLLSFMTVQRYFSTKETIIRGICGSFVLWTLIVMTNAAMRLAAVSFMFGLAYAQFDFDETT